VVETPVAPVIVEEEAAPAVEEVPAVVVEEEVVETPVAPVILGNNSGLLTKQVLVEPFSFSELQSLLPLSSEEVKDDDVSFSDLAAELSKFE